MLPLRKVTATVARCVRSKHCLPDLPYEYAALEPIISREIMIVHHTRHHQTYINNLNAAEEKLSAAAKEVKSMRSVVMALVPSLNFNGGGHLNHSMFWQNLTPGSTQPSQELCRAITNSLGSMENLKKQLSAAAIAIQGSGWGWLGYEKETGLLRIATSANQDPLESTTGLIPLLGIDVWEHAYYLQYKDARDNYVHAIFDIVNWKDVSERYKKAAV